MYKIHAVAVLIIATLQLSYGIADTFGAQQPYPDSDIVADFDWEPANGIERAAEGGDNWPTTWAADGRIFTAYGDGRGFQPKVEQKLSLGYAEVLGSGEDWSGNNIRSATGEQTGGGKNGKKASSLLAVDGTLYMWVRNADLDGNGCQLAWSEDDARTWTFSNWQFDQFGYCVFLNYGQDYNGARDDYVYMYSPNSPSAYDPADDMVLTRVHKGSLRDESAYEYFAGMNGSNPQWSSSIGARASVFSHDNNCLRSGISYNAALDRYFWWQQVAENGVDTRFEGGFGVYDAPEPWGPWTTAYFTNDWDVGPGDAASFPTKWISSDGLTMYLVFAGDDSFSVRSATLEVNSGDGDVPKPPVIDEP